MSVLEMANLGPVWFVKMFSVFIFFFIGNNKIAPYFTLVPVFKICTGNGENILLCVIFTIANL